MTMTNYQWNQTLTHLKLSRNRMMSTDVSSLFEALQFNSTLCLLDMSNNCTSDAGAQQQIPAVLPNMPGLQKLFFLSNDIQSEASSLAFSQAMQITNRRLQVLDIKQTLPHVPQFALGLIVRASISISILVFKLPTKKLSLLIAVLLCGASPLCKRKTGGRSCRAAPPVCTCWLSRLDQHLRIRTSPLFPQKK
jgi:hypothetical protein